MTCLINTRTGKVLIQSLLVRKNFWGRLRGLMLVSGLVMGQGLFLIGTTRIHTYGMRFALDLYYFDDSFRLIGLSHNIKPWRMPKSPKKTKHILEVEHYSIAGNLRLNIGDRVTVIW